MANPLILYRNLWRDGTIIAASSEAAQFPAEYTQDDSPQLFWRSRNGTGTGNGLFVVTVDVNDHIDLAEGAGELPATLTPGNYNGLTLAAEIKTQLDVAGALTYTVTYDETIGKFTIAASGNFELLWHSGTHNTEGQGVLLGFAHTDLSGAATYTSDTAVFHSEERIDCDLGAAHEYNFIALLNHNLTSAATIIIYGADDAAFTDGVVHDHLTFNGNNLYEILAAAQTKRYVRISLLNVANPSAYLQIGTIVVGKGNALNRGPSVPYQRGPLNETEIEFSPSANLFTVQERPSLDNKLLLFTGLDGASELIVEALLEACGSHVAWVLCLDSAAPNTNSYWVHLKSQELPKCQHVNYWNWPAEIEVII